MKRIVRNLFISCIAVLIGLQTVAVGATEMPQAPFQFPTKF